MEYTVIVERKHCIGTDYSNVFNCPLACAIREQLDDFRLWMVGGADVHGRSYKRGIFFNHWGKMKTFNFPSMEWHWGTVQDLLSGRIESVTITFSDRLGSVVTKYKEYFDIKSELASKPIQQEVPDIKIKEVITH